MSATPDSTLADSERRIADLERQLAEREAELAECKAERDEALQRETATAEVLGVINSSPGDLAPVFDAILEKAIRLCEAAFGTLLTYDGERFTPAAVRGVPTAFAAFLRERGAFAPLSGSSLERAVNGESLVHIIDAAINPGEAGTPVVELGGCRTVVSVALRKDNNLVGIITAYRQEVRRFTDKQIALFQNFAAQAVIAMENARLLTETREALEQQTATAEILRVIAGSTANAQPAFDAIAAAAIRLTGASLSGVATYDGKLMHLAAMSGVTPEEDENIRAVFPIPADDSTATGRAILTRRVMHIEQMPASSEHPYPRLARSSGQTVLAVPMLRDGIPVGAINVQRRQAKPFTDKQIGLFKSFADQAVIAMENARLLIETREALEQQTATAEVLGVINSSPGSLGPVFEAILEKAHGLCGIDFGALQLQDGGKFYSVAERGLAPSLTKLMHQPFEPVPGSPPSRLLGGERIVHIADMAEATQTRSNPRAQAVAEHGFRTGLFVPLRKDTDLLGYIVAIRREMRPFSEREIALLEGFAAQAVIAMENARLITETREALEQQTATAEVLGVINSSPGNPTPVFDAILEKALRLCEGNFGALLTYDGEFFSLAAERGHQDFDRWLREAGAVRFRPQPGMVTARIIDGERVVHIADIRDKEAYPGGELIQRGLIERGGFRTLLSVALHKDATLLGVININRQEVRPFTDKQIALLQNFAAQAVIAIENARLLGELHQRTEEVAELNRGLEARVAEQVDELGRVGRLKRFLAPQLAELIVSQGNEQILESHRRDIVVVFCDVRGYTAFTETAEPEEVLEFLRQYHGALGPLVSQFEGTLDQFSGDGIMVFFNDPVPCPDPAERAVRMAMAMREAAGKLIATWLRDGCALGFGAGIAQGYATLGQIGFSERSGYTAIGTVCNLAARLCAEAKDGQILVSSRVARAVEAVARLEDLGSLELKGLRRPVAAFNVVQSTSAPDARPNLTVIASGPGV